MYTHLEIENLRIISKAVFQPSSGLNAIMGSNGAGKTTLLEAAYLLAVGRSFRSREITPLIRQGTECVRLIGRFVDSNGNRHVIGMQKDRKSLAVRFDGRTSVKRSEILQLLPVHYIGSDPQELLTGTPDLRRSFLDGGMFHVEPKHLKTLQGYMRVLAQRNASLRSGRGDPFSWNPQLISFAGLLDDARADYIAALGGLVSEILEDWALDLGLEIEYRRGWSKKLCIEEALLCSEENDRSRLHTTIGPHRADILVSVHSLRGRKILSRGQMKMVVLAMYLAQAKLNVAHGRGLGVLLFDDFAAELDRGNREKALSGIEAHYSQVITTVLDPGELMGRTAITLFHVEHGTLTEA